MFVTCATSSTDIINTGSQWYRRYSLAGDCLTPDGQVIQAIQYGIGLAEADPVGAGFQPGHIKLYTIDPAAPLLLANMTLVHEETIPIPDGTNTIQTEVLDDLVCVLADVDVVVELGVPDAVAAGRTDSFFPGSNDAGATAPAYFASTDCNFIEPTDLATLGFPNHHLVIDIDMVVPAIGAPYCGALNNSTGKPTQLFAFGSQNATFQNLSFVVCDGPPGEFVFILGPYGQDSI